jgi:DNA-binding transcriptional regulator YdaS (Cro superfamily)
MACGQNVVRLHYRAGSSVCKRCEALEQGQALAEGLLEATAAVDEEAAPMPRAEGVVAGSAEALAWLHARCGGQDALTLDQIVDVLRQMEAERVQMIGRVTRYGAVPGQIRPEDVPLEVAATALWLACDPVLQDRLTAAQEVLQISLNQLMIGNLAYHDQDLLDQDQSLVPQASYAVQYGVGPRGRQGLLGRTGLPGGRLVDASGQLVKDCLCCGREFHPPRERPNPDFCDEGCGTFADQVRIWATNTVLNELRYPGSADPAPLPDPRTFWQVERCQEPYLGHAMQFREQRVAQQMDLARAQQQKMRGM